MASKFVKFIRDEDADRDIMIDISKLVAYEPSGNRQFPEDEYTCLNMGTGLIYVNEPFEDVDKKIKKALAPYDPDKRI